MVTAAPEISCLLPTNMKQFGRYDLLYRFASGGMANLYLARLSGSDGFSKAFAIKVMHTHLTADPEFVKMFIDEARLVGRINHPNVAQVLDLGRFDTSHYIALEFVDGESALALMRRTKPSFACCARIIADAAAGLHAAHELRDEDGAPLDVIHRDLSPDNILISYDGIVKIIDFGVARVRNSLHTTTAGTIRGKFSYMAPEELSGGPTDRRTDIFSLGVVLYEMTTRRRLFKRACDGDILEAVRACQILSPSLLVKDYPRRLERIVMTALQRNPATRFQTALEFRAALEGYLRAEPMILQSSVGEMLRTVFSDHIKKKQALRRRFEEEQSHFVPDIEPSTESAVSLPEVGEAASQHRSGQDHRQRRWVLWLLLALLVLTGTSAAILWGAGISSSPFGEDVAPGEQRWRSLYLTPPRQAPAATTMRQGQRTPD